MKPSRYRGAHFAVFPPELPERCIRAGTSEGGCCSECGTPYTRAEDDTFAPGCTCGAPSAPCVVLDPFLGSGTTAVVARALGRHAVGVEVKQEYVDDLVKPRLAEQPETR